MVLDQQLISHETYLAQSIFHVSQVPILKELVVRLRRVESEKSCITRHTAYANRTQHSQECVRSDMCECFFRHRVPALSRLVLKGEMNFRLLSERERIRICHVH